MKASTTRFTHAEPELLRCLSGRWLAVSSEQANIHIGVEGTTEQEARERFANAVAAWERLWTDEPSNEQSRLMRR